MIQTSSSILTKIATYSRIIIQPDWSVNLKSNTLPVDVWLEFKSGNRGETHITQNVHGFCSIYPFTDKNASNYRTSSSDFFQSANIDKKQQQLCIKVQATDFSVTFQGN